MKLSRLLNVLVVLSVLSVLSVFFTINSHASSIMNYPGTRARSMGMAFTAISDDASAVWYNPAGLAIGSDGGIDFIAEGSETINYELDKETRPFIALKSTGQKGGFALSYFTPYTFATQVKRLDIISLGGAYKCPFRIRIGGTLEVVRLSLDSDYEAIIEEDALGIGLSGSLGGQWTALNYKPWGLRIQFGGAYRLESNMDEEAYKPFNKPASWNYGVALMKSVTPLHSNLIFSGQYERTEYSAIDEKYADYEMTSYGFEWQIALDGFLSRVALRAGKYTEEPKGVYSNFEMNGNTYGIGMRFGESWGLEYSLENREWVNNSFKKDFTLHALALTYSHQLE